VSDTAHATGCCQCDTVLQGVCQCLVLCCRVFVSDTVCATGCCQCLILCYRVFVSV
jgi:hypothetical protein